jgi:hypothetical protein
VGIILGSNDFFGIPFPLVLADRFFHIYSAGERFAIDVFRWEEHTKQAVYEVQASQPQDESISTNPTGIVTFSEPTTGDFLYKFRPKPGISQIFGKVPLNVEFEVKISDREIIVLGGGKSICTLQSNQFQGMPIGIQVGADGSVGIGVNKLPERMTLTRYP